GHDAAWLGPGVPAHVSDTCLDLAEDQSRVPDELLTCGCQGDRTRSSIDERGAERSLQVFDVPADRGLREAEFDGGLQKSPVVGHGNERFDPAQLHARHYHRSRYSASAISPCVMLRHLRTLASPQASRSVASPPPMH